MKTLKLSFYIILPILFFCIWYLLCCFVTYQFIPRLMSDTQRYVIASFGLMAFILGIVMSVEINKK